METIKYLLVTEGPTDFIILEKISSIISKNIDKHIEFVQLSPQKDQTSDRYSDHGWKEVRKWCRLYGKNKDDLANVFARLSSKSKNWKTLVKVSNAKGIIIQIDTDIAEYIDEINFRYQGTNKLSRKRFCEKVILNWLGEDSLVEGLYFMKSTDSTETFILATFPRNHENFNDLPAFFDFEDIKDVIPRLIKFGLTNYTREDGINRLSKDLGLYEKYSDMIEKNFTKVRQECQEIDFLCQKLEN